MWRVIAALVLGAVLTQLRLGVLEEATARCVASLRKDFIYRGYVTCFDCAAAASRTSPQCEYVDAYYCVEVPLRRGLVNHPPYLYMAMGPICTLAFLFAACVPFLVYGRGATALAASLLRIVLVGLCIFLINIGRFWLCHALMLADFTRLWTHHIPLWLIILAVSALVIWNYRRATNPRSSMNPAPIRGTPDSPRNAA